VWRALGAPTPAGHIVTVAGTNGKGSSVAFLDAVLRAAGYRTACYTSPHLLRYTERIRIDGGEIDETSLCDAFERVEAARGEIALTYFEFGTLAALWCMAQQPLDVAILEVGLGGRLDAVNIVDAEVALITGIGLDHTDWLGDDVEAIAGEKAGIARAQRPLVFAARQMPEAIERVAGASGACLYRLGRDYDYRVGDSGWEWQAGDFRRSGLPLPGMRGAAQLQNAAGALMVLHLLQTLHTDQRAIREGLLQARVAGRFEVRQRRCPWILDVAHNPQAAAVLAAQLADLYVAGTRHVVVGMLGDKAIAEVLAVISALADRWHLLDLSDEPRGATADRMMSDLPENARDNAMLHESVQACLSYLDRIVTERDQVLVFGSFVTVGRALAWLSEAKPI
jgi:dihydrofolate synthase/folylpolyglutamate synthase